MLVLSPTYTLRIEIADRSRVSGPVADGMSGLSFVQNPGSPYRYFGPDKTGCDDVLKAVRDALKAANIEATVSFERFEHKA